MTHIAESRTVDSEHTEAPRLRIAASTPVATALSTTPQLHLRKWMKYERAQRIVGCSKLLRRLTIGLFARLELLILSGHKDPSTLRKIRRCRRSAESLLTGNEAFLLYSLARAQRRLDGAMAELGVYQGNSAQIICEAKEDRTLHLFDTFTGLPEVSEIDRRALTQGQFAANLHALQHLLKTYRNVRVHPGLFPHSACAVVDLRFSLVHLDADLYSSTLAGLEFFYPRVLPGGIIIVHDYSTLPGVAQALTDFLSQREELLIELPTTQAMIVL